MSETVTASARAYRYGRTEQGQSGILWSVYEGPTPDDFQNGAKVASFVRWRDAWNYIQPFAAVRCKCGHEMAQHARPERVNCIGCDCSIPWPLAPDAR